jgi:hypothetical protein
LKKSLLFGLRGRFGRGDIGKKSAAVILRAGILCAFGFHRNRIVILVQDFGTLFV